MWEVNAIFRIFFKPVGVKFDSRVVRRPTCTLGEGCLELNLPLNVSDLSAFSSKRDCVAFPHITLVRDALLGGAEAGDGQETSDTETKVQSRFRKAKNKLLQINVGIGKCI